MNIGLIQAYAFGGKMASRSSIPDSIKKFAPTTCCQVRNDHGTYRVYRSGSKKKPDGTWTRDTGYLIGKIVEQVGFIPNFFKPCLQEIIIQPWKNRGDESELAVRW